MPSRRTGCVASCFAVETPGSPVLDLLQVLRQHRIDQNIGEHRAVLFHRDPDEMIEFAVLDAAHQAAAAGGGELVIVHALADEFLRSGARARRKRCRNAR